MTRLADLVRSVAWADVLRALERDYGIFWRSPGPGPYRLVFRHLQIVEPIEQTQRLYVEPMQASEFDVDPPEGIPADVGGADEAETYAWEYSPWAEWLGLIVKPETRERYSDAEIVAHCLEEMTWVSFDEQNIRERREELERRAQSVLDGTAKLIPWEDVKERLNWKDE